MAKAEHYHFHVKHLPWPDPGPIQTFSEGCPARGSGSNLQASKAGFGIKGIRKTDCRQKVEIRVLAAVEALNLLGYIFGIMFGPAPYFLLDSAFSF